MSRCSAQRQSTRRPPAGRLVAGSGRPAFLSRDKKRDSRRLSVTGTLAPMTRRSFTRPGALGRRSSIAWTCLGVVRYLTPASWQALASAGSGNEDAMSTRVRWTLVTGIPLRSVASRSSVRRARWTITPGMRRSFGARTSGLRRSGLDQSPEVRSSSTRQQRTAAVGLHSPEVPGLQAWSEVSGSVDATVNLGQHSFPQPVFDLLRRKAGIEQLMRVTIPCDLVASSRITQSAVRGSPPIWSTSSDSL